MQLDWKAYGAFVLLAGYAIGAIQWGYRDALSTWKRGFTLAAALLPVSTFLFILSVQTYGFADFRVYWEAANRVLTDPTSLYGQDNRPCVEGFAYIPIVAWQFVPLVPLGARGALTVFTLAGIASAAYACWRLVRLGESTPSQRAVVIGLFAASGPLFYSIGVGNVSHFVLLLIVLALFNIEHGRPYVGGALLAVASLNKPFLLIFGPCLALRREWRPLAAFVLTLASLVTLSVALFGTELHRAWANRCVSPFSGGIMGAFNNQSVDGVAARVLLGSDPFDWVPVPMPPRMSILRYLVMLAAAAAPVLAAWRGRTVASVRARRLDYAAALTVGVLVSPVSWTHYELFLLLPLALFAGGQADPPRHPFWRMALVCAVCLLSPPVIWWVPRRAVVQWVFYRIVLTHYFVGAALLLGAVVAARLERRREVTS